MRMRQMKLPDKSLVAWLFFGAVLLLGDPSGAVAQRAVLMGGVVVDDITLDPISNATIAIEAAGIETQTREDGTFGFFELPEGSASVRVSAPGRLTIVDEIEVQSDVPSFARFVMSSVDIVLSDLLVRGAPTSEEDYGPNMTAADLVARKVPGLPSDNRGLGPDSYYGPLKLRGSSSLSTRGEPIVFLDGVRLGGLGGALEQLSQIRASDVEEVTVLKGPSASFLYALASHGVILVVTK